MNYKLYVKKGKKIVDKVLNKYKDDKQVQKSLSFLENKDRDHVWAFNAGHSGNSFCGNPKYLFIYINKYRKDIAAYWLCSNPQITEFVQSLGYNALTVGTYEAEVAIDSTGVYVAEQVKMGLPSGIKHVKYLNLYHGVGAKDIERVALTGDMAEHLAKKYIMHNEFYRNNQLFLCPSSMMQKDFVRMCGLEENQVLNGGYPRNIYQKYFEVIETYDHDIRKQKGLSKDAKLVVYAPTFRKGMKEDVFPIAIEDIKRLIEVCKKNNLLFIFKMHPFMENEFAFLQAKKEYGDNPHLLFWDNKNDFYEIINQVDLAIIDYSSIFTDFVNAGIEHFIRYVFDYEEEVKWLNHDYMSVTAGTLCYDFNQLLEAINTFQEKDESKDCERINSLYWEYSEKNSLEKIIDETMKFQPVKRTLPTLYSFDIFDTVISRKVLDPKGIFVKVKEEMAKSNLDFDPYFIRNYVKYREDAELNVRDYYRRTTDSRKTDKIEIHFCEIFDKLQWVYHLTNNQKEYLMQAEIEAELDNVIPVKENIDHLKMLVEQGETVVLISDMYLPKQIIIQMIKKADPVLATVPLFLSEEYGVQKTTRQLYLEVYRSFKPFYDFKKWVHYGDNLKADIQSARAMGIEAELVDKPEFNRFENMIIEKIGTYDSYLVAAMIARFRYYSKFDQEYFAYGYQSLCFVPYVNWVLSDAVRKGYETLYFISRDGHHLKRIADVIIQEKGLNIKTRYIYASRKTWRVPSYIDEIDDAFWGTYGNFAKIERYKDLLKAMMMDEETFMRMFPNLMFLKEKAVFKEEETLKIVDILKNSEQFKQYILDYAKEKRKSVCGYLKQEINADEKFAFVEYWGRGYTQETFTRLWNNITGKEEKSYFYYSRTVLPSDKNNIRYNFSTNNVSQIFIEAFFANLPYNTVEEYEFIDGKYKPVIKPRKCDEVLYKATEKYLVQFAYDYISLGMNRESETNHDLYDFMLDYYVLNQEDELFIKMLAPLKDSVSTYAKMIDFAPPFTEKSLKEMREKRPRKEMTRSVPMSFYRATPKVQNEYRMLYQIKEGEDLRYGKFSEAPVIAAHKEFDEKKKKLLKNNIERRKKYEKACIKCAMKDMILFILDKKASLDPSIIKLKSMLSNETTFSVEQIIISDTDSIDANMEAIASAKYIIMMKPTEYLSGISLRDETKTVILGDVPFPYSRRRLNAYNEREYVEMVQTTVQKDVILYQSEELISTMSDIYHTKNESRFSLQGSVQTDLYYDTEFKKNARNKLKSVFPESNGKKVIVYMPMVLYRNPAVKYRWMMEVKRLKEYLPEEYVVATYACPSITDKVNGLEVPGFSMDVSKKMDIREALCAADIIVGDYKDMIFESCMLNVPVYFWYGKTYEFLRNRDLICPLDETQYGPVVLDEKDLAEQILKCDDYDYSKMKAFKEKFFTYCDGDTSKRICEYILESEKGKRM